MGRSAAALLFVLMSRNEYARKHLLFIGIFVIIYMYIREI